MTRVSDCRCLDGTMDYVQSTRGKKKRNVFDSRWFDSKLIKWFNAIYGIKLE